MNKNLNLKDGDRVVCIDASASFNRLVEKGEYKVSIAYDGKTQVVVVNGADHSIERFVPKSDFLATEK